MTARELSQYAGPLEWISTRVSEEAKSKSLSVKILGCAAGSSCFMLPGLFGWLLFVL